MQQESIIPAKSPNDTRSYEALQLPNKLKVMFIHDSEIVKSACSISVGVGSLHDKDRSLGLAHFLEHMLFMGSEKFPSHNEYTAFISANSGSDNAYTGDKETNYYFEVKNSAFLEATERMINFFTGALLKEECIEKESQAVHEEFVLWTNDDNCRKWEVLRKLASPPYCRFSIGNVQTLRHEHIRQDLVEFYNTYYSANIMNAVMCSSLSIEEMKSAIIPLLAAIPNKEVELPAMGPHFTQGQTGKLVSMQSIKDEAILQFFFVVEYLQPLYKHHVNDYISHMVGHEGTNSLLSILKAKGYASELSAYAHDLKTQTLVGMEVKLTEEGEYQYEAVYNIVMDYVSYLRADGQVYQEIRQKKQIEFQFKEKKAVSSYVTELSSDMHDIKLEEILKYKALFEDFNEELLNKVLNQLNPFNAIVVLSSSEPLEGDVITEKYLGAKYTVQPLPERNKSGFSFQPIPPNPYLPIDTALLAATQPESFKPRQVGQNIHFLQNSSFKVCKGGLQLRIFSTEDYEFMDFYTGYLNLLLKELTYPAETLSLDIQYEPDECITITIFGFSDTVLRLVRNMAGALVKLHDGKDSQTLFDVSLADLIEEYQNTYNQESDEVATTVLDILLNDRYGTIESGLEKLNHYDYAGLTTRIKNFWRSNTFKWVVVGNFEQEPVVKLIEQFEKQVKGTHQNTNLIENRCLQLTEDVRNHVLLVSEDLSSSCTIVYYQAGPYSEELYYKLLLLKNHVDEPFFNELRTMKQMAYYLRAKIENTRGVLGIYFILVSSAREPINISHEIKNFLSGFFSKLEQDLSGDNYTKLEGLKQSVFTKLNAPHNNLKALFEFVCEEIGNKTYYFSRKQEAEIRGHLSKITGADLAQLWHNIKDRTLQVYVVSKAHQQDYLKNQVQCKAVEEIKKNAKFIGI